MKKHFLTLGLLAAIALPASAEGVYVFGDLGQSKLSIDSAGAGGGETNTTYSLGVGYALNKTFSLELAYRDLGKINMYQNQYSKVDETGSAIQGSVLVKYPLSDSVNLFGRVGFAGLTYEYDYKSFSNPANNESHSDEQNKGFFGLGADYKLNEHLSLRAEYNQYGKREELQTSTLTVGAVYSF